MNYLKFTQYAYLIASLFFAYEAYNQYSNGETNQAIVMIAFTIVAIFMFFFRRSYGKKFAERSKRP